MKNKIIISIIGMCLLGIMLGYTDILDNEKSVSLINNSFTIFTLTGFYLLLSNGSFFKTIFFKLTMIGISILIIGGMFKIMHWPFAALLLIVGMLSILVFYSIHFYHKINKFSLDYFKLIILFLILTSRIVKIFRWPYGWELVYISQFVFLLFIIYYIITETKSGKLLMN